MSRGKDPNYIKAPAAYGSILDKLLSGQRTAIEDLGTASLIGRLNKSHSLFQVKKEKTAELIREAKIVNRTPKYVLIKVGK